MQRDPATLPDPDEDLLGDPDDVEVSIEEQIDERLQAERDDDED